MDGTCYKSKWRNLERTALLSCFIKRVVCTAFSDIATKQRWITFNHTNVSMESSARSQPILVDRCKPKQLFAGRSKQYFVRRLHHLWQHRPAKLYANVSLPVWWPNPRFGRRHPLFLARTSVFPIRYYGYSTRSVFRRKNTVYIRRCG